MYLSDLNPATPPKNPASEYELKKADSASDSANGSSVTRDTISDKDYDVLNSYNFVLRVEGFQNVPLKAVRGINKQNEYEYIQEGGLNDYVHMVRKPISQPFTFQVERYVSQDWLQDAIDPLANGTELVLPLILYMYRSNAHDGTAPSRYYVFTNCRVTGVQVGDLDAEKSGLHTITNTIAYAQMTIITIPFAGIGDEIYSFNSNNAENKVNTSHVRTIKDMGITRVDAPTDTEGKTQEEVDIEAAELNYRGNRTKQEMELLKKKYSFVGSGNSGNTKNLYNTIVQNQEASTKEIMKDKAKKYKFNPKTGTNTGGKSAEANNLPSDQIQTQNQTGFSKSDMEEKAAKGKYQISLDNKNANKVNTDSYPKPEKPAASKSSMENTAKGKKYKFKKSNKPNTENTNAAEPKVPPMTKEAMQNKAKKYNFKNKRNGSAVKDELEISKTAMEAMAKQNQSHFGDAPSMHVVSQDNEPAQIRKYPAQRSAKSVSEFLKGR